MAHPLRHFGCGAREIETAREESLQWALLRGSRSGRIAFQFARDWAGRHVSGGARIAATGKQAKARK